MRSKYPENVANEVLDELQITGPEDLQLLSQIAFARGAIVREDQLVGAEARLTYLRGTSIITVSSNIISPERKRFSICHELGHLEMHPRLFLCTENDISDRDFAEKENDEFQANQFASAFLLPSRFVERIFIENIPTFDLIRDIASNYRTSLAATALRMIDFSQEPVAVAYSEKGKIKWFKGTDDFMKMEVFVNVRAPVNPNTNAGRLFRGKEIRDGWREEPANCWLREGDYREDATIKESSIHMPNYDAVLTLLWIDEIIEHEELF
jgi:Zn-dependent peptidase ImmA (M78 family)